MDDEIIPRRDAIAGLGLMGMLLIALVGTIVFRIVNSSRDHAGPPRRSMASVEVAPDAAAGSFASGAASEAHEAPIVAEPIEFDAVKPAAHEHQGPRSPGLESEVARPAAPSEALPQLDSEAPRFVAPSGR